MTDTQKTPAEMLEALGKPFPKAALKQRKGSGGRTFTYIETHSCIHRLNSATNGWDFHIKDVQWRNDVLIVQGELTIHGLGTRSGFGVQQVVERAGEDLVKGAASDALKKCATLFGVALELYGSDYEANDAPSAPQKGSQAPAKPTPTNAGDDKPITDAAMKRIHALLAEQNLGHEYLTIWAIDHGHESSKQLTMGQVTRLGNGLKENPEAVIKYLNRLKAHQESGKIADAQKAGN